MSFFENTRKPVGLGGKIMVAMMNFGHSAMAEWAPKSRLYFQNVSFRFRYATIICSYSK